ncbi:MAG: hypothetical protein MHM6MM_000238 [Cercozoa sp. M6MM]
MSKPDSGRILREQNGMRSFFDSLSAWKWPIALGAVTLTTAVTAATLIWRRKAPRLSKLVLGKRGNELRIASWNVLAQRYIFDGSFNYARINDFLTFDLRRLALAARTKELDADIIALQEVDRADSFWKPLLQAEGYEVDYAQRPCGRDDGCLIAWRANQFEPEARLEIYMNDLCHGLHRKQDTRLVQKYARNNVAQIVLLRHKHGAKNGGFEFDRRILLANVHLYWNPAHEDVKVRQAQYLLRRVHEFHEHHCPDAAIALCGDFNACPGSPVHTLVTQGVFEERLTDTTGVPALMMDATLSKVAKWCRTLGYDVECGADDAYQIESTHGRKKRLRMMPIETAEPEEFFRRIRGQRRFLVTCAKKLTSRASIPSPFLFLRHGGATDAFDKVQEYFKLKFHLSRLCSRCVKCNGGLEDVTCADQIDSFDDDDVPVLVKERAKENLGNSALENIDIDAVYDVSDVDSFREFLEWRRQDPTLRQCTRCSSVFWWGDKTVKSARKLHRIFFQQQLVDQENSSKTADTSDSSPCEVSLSSETHVIEDTAVPYLHLLPEVAYRSDHFMSQTLSSDLVLRSAVELKEGSEREYTNRTDKFQGTLDYVFLGDGRKGKLHPLQTQIVGLQLNRPLPCTCLVFIFCGPIPLPFTCTNRRV